MISSSKYHITTDDFTKEKIIIWDEVEGQNQLKFHKIGNFCIEFEIKNNIPFLLLWYNCKGKIVNIGSVVSFLFEDGTLLNFTITEKPIITKNTDIHLKWAHHYIKLNETDINFFSTKRLSRMRICLEDKYTNWTTENEGYNRLYNENVLLLMDYARAFNNAIKEIGIDLSEHTEIDRTIPSTEPCFVYLMCDTTNGFYKIGISNRPTYREHTLQSEKPTIELICAKQYPERLIAEAIEAALHKAYDSKHLRGEWYKLSIEDVENLKKTLQ